MLRHPALALLLLLFVAGPASAERPKEFRLRLLRGYPSASQHAEQCVEIRVRAGERFSFGSRELGWSISGILTAADAWPRFTGDVRVASTSASFASTPFVDRVLDPREFMISSVLTHFYLTIEDI